MNMGYTGLHFDTVVPCTECEASGPQLGIRFQVSVPKILCSFKTHLCPALESSAQGGHGRVGESPEKATRMLRKG